MEAFVFIYLYNFFLLNVFVVYLNTYICIFYMFNVYGCLRISMCHLVIMTRNGDGDCHCNAIRGTMYLRIVGKIQSVSPIGFPVFVVEFSLRNSHQV